MSSSLTPVPLVHTPTPKLTARSSVTISIRSSWTNGSPPVTVTRVTRAALSAGISRSLTWATDMNVPRFVAFTKQWLHSMLHGSQIWTRALRCG